MLYVDEPVVTSSTLQFSSQEPSPPSQVDVVQHVFLISMDFCSAPLVFHHASGGRVHISVCLPYHVHCWDCSMEQKLLSSFETPSGLAWPLAGRPTHNANNEFCPHGEENGNFPLETDFQDGSRALKKKADFLFFGRVCTENELINAGNHHVEDCGKKMRWGENVQNKTSNGKASKDVRGKSQTVLSGRESDWGKETLF